MPYIQVGQENSGSIELYYEDHGSGSGDPVVLIHGWPLSGKSWEKQVQALLAAGHRVITYDRRGFGLSTKAAVGYDYDTLAQDLYQLLTKLELNDVTLVGFSMGGGEVARYLGARGTLRVKAAAFISAIPPFLLKTHDNPEGVDQKVFDEIKTAINADRPAFLSSFFSNFYNLDRFLGSRISEEVVRVSWNIASNASPIGTLQCVSSWLEDFRKDLKEVDVPVLVVHGDADRIVPLSASAQRMSKMMPKIANDPNSFQLTVLPGAPHGLNWTHAEELNRELLGFLERVSMGAARKAG